MINLLPGTTTLTTLVVASLAGGSAVAQSHEIEIVASGRATVEVPAAHGRLVVVGAVEDPEATEETVEEIARANRVQVNLNSVAGDIWALYPVEADVGEAFQRYNAHLFGTTANLLAARDALADIGLDEVNLVWEGDTGGPGVEAGMADALEAARSTVEVLARSQGCALGRLSSVEITSPTRIATALDYSATHPNVVSIGEFRTIPDDDGSKRLSAQKSSESHPTATVHIAVSATFTARCA